MRGRGAREVRRAPGPVRGARGRHGLGARARRRAGPQGALVLRLLRVLVLRRALAGRAEVPVAVGVDAVDEAVEHARALDDARLLLHEVRQRGDGLGRRDDGSADDHARRLRARRRAPRAGAQRQRLGGHEREAARQEHGYRGEAETHQRGWRGLRVGARAELALRVLRAQLLPLQVRPCLPRSHQTRSRTPTRIVVDRSAASCS